MSNAETVRTFIDAFNEHDLDAFAMTLHPEVELHAGRGVRKGVDLARVWAERTPGGLQQTILVDELRERGDRVLALIARVWRWDEEEEGSEPARSRADGLAVRASGRPDLELAAVRRPGGGARGLRRRIGLAYGGGDRRAQRGRARKGGTRGADPARGLPLTRPRSSPR